MPRPFDKWTVLPHQPIEAIDDNILAVEGLLGKFPRRMVVVRISGGRSIIHSGIALDEPEMKRLENFGKPAFYIAPGAKHRMEAKPWKQRYPDMVVVCPAGARKAVEEVVKVDTTAPDFGDPSVHYPPIDGTAERECVLVVEGPQGTTLVLNDIMFNVRKQPGIVGFIFGMLGVTGPEPKIARILMRLLVKDKAALRAQLERWANMERLKRIVLSHGATIEADPRGTLRRIAAGID